MRRCPKWVIVVLAVGIIAGLAACQTMAGRSVGDVMNDATITSKVKTKLFADDRLSGFGISVDTFQGEVTLIGGVKTEADKELATRVAKDVHGVKEVNNLLTVRQTAW